MGQPMNDIHSRGMQTPHPLFSSQVIPDPGYFQTDRSLSPAQENLSVYVGNSARTPGSPGMWPLAGKFYVESA